MYSARTLKRIVGCLAVTGTALMVGCASTNTSDTQVSNTPDTSEFDQGPVPQTSSARDTAVNQSSQPALDEVVVYFDFDDSNLQDSMRSVLSKAAADLRSSGAPVTIEGHCDARGSDEYNIALGDRRAEMVRRFLVDSGVDEGRLTTVSFGESRPAVRGDTESAYRWNRRVLLRAAEGMP